MNMVLLKGQELSQTLKEAQRAGWPPGTLHFLKRAQQAPMRAWMH